MNHCMVIPLVQFATQAALGHYGAQLTESDPSKTMNVESASMVVDRTYEDNHFAK